MGPFRPSQLFHCHFISRDRMAPWRVRIDIMPRFKIDFRGDAFRNVLGFTVAHWRHQPVRIALLVAGVMLSTLADVMTPLFAGHLVEAVASGAAADTIAWNAALTAFWVLAALGLTAVVLRQF